MSVTTASFGATPEGEEVSLFTCENNSGLRLQLTNYGAIVVAVETPDRDGRLANINLGFPSLAGYLQRHPYFGSTVGRYGNRIAFGKFSIDGVEYQLATNNGPHHLHGGEVGFDRAVWTTELMDADGESGVRFRHTSPDGDEGFPGELQVEVVYSLNDNNELRMEHVARTDRATHVNLTNHCYWNLAGVAPGKAASVLEHRLQLEADQYVAVDGTLIPTGELPEVAGTPLDFREMKSIGRDLGAIEADPPGYDHCFVVRGAGELRRAAIASDPHSGRVMEVLTNQPGIQLYTGNFLDGSDGCGGYGRHSAFCLETQHYPDTPNQSTFPSTILRPGDVYRHLTVHRFSVG
ncbi:MAG: galactose mutarotase [Planctomycetales bacterium]|nr:galactose mutarotase [Planctomycetales bacterium]